MVTQPRRSDTRNDVNSDAVGVAPTAHKNGIAGESLQIRSEALASDQGTHSKLWATKLVDTVHEDVHRARKREVILAKPTTYMNGSGEAAKELIERLSITPAEILVIVDDFQIPLGAIRFRPNGSDGGHNGLASVIEELGTQAFTRLRLGVGAPIDKAQVVDYVLSRFSKQEVPSVEKMLAVAAEGYIRHHHRQKW